MFSRREILRALAVVPGVERLRAEAAAAILTHRVLGRTGRWITPLGLGGQASLQWTPEGVDPAGIIVQAVEMGVNYLDSANAYGPSQRNYGEAFRRLALAENAPLRERLYIASKTTRRDGPGAAAELHASIRQMFDDAEGAYLDSIQIHNLTSLAQVDQIYAPNGALAALLDFRDGTNYTGLNAGQRRLVRHIGITGHQSSQVLMNALQRDDANAIDTVLVALNANDRRFCSHQHNVVPLALARGCGIVAMKAFADGVFYGKPRGWSSNPSHVVQSVGEDSGDFIRYPLSIPGVATVIVGTGRVEQLPGNLDAALAERASALERRRIEDRVADRDTNYFQDRRDLIQPTGVRVERDGDRVWVRWNTAYAGAEPIRFYRVYAGERLLLTLPYRPQTTTAPLAAWFPELEGEVRVEALA